MIDKLIDKIIETKNPSVIGLDTKASYLPDYEQIKSNVQAGERIFAFNKAIIDAVYDIVPCVKVQVAYYEMYGLPGIKAFYDTVAYASSRGLIVISDVKRNDISSTAEAYSSAYLGVNDLGEAAFASDFITVNAYLGSDGIAPFVKDCAKYNKGVFILVRTSNPSGRELQNLYVTLNKKMLYEIMGEYVQEWGKELIGKYGYSSVGAVVGATHPEEAAKLRAAHPSVFFLVPGYGAQGASAEEITVSFDNRGLGAIVNSSRAILCAYKKEQYSHLSPSQAARQAAIAMREDITGALRQKGINF
jgi:orotidine-5'-phosphate decarboxylase